MNTFFLPQAQGDTLWTAVVPLWLALLIYLLLINLIAFLMMGADKRHSRREGARRIPEKRLFLAAALGGSLGAVLGMRAFRHKTRHWYFVWGMPAILLAQLALGVFLFWKLA